MFVGAQTNCFIEMILLSTTCTKAAHVPALISFHYVDFNGVCCSVKRFVHVLKEEN